MVTGRGTAANSLRLGSRGSALALWQARHVKARLEEAHAGLQVEIVILRTTGDRITDVPLSRIGDKGLFTREIDRAMVDAEIDLAVHSLKDVPTRLADGLALGAVLEREDPRDALLASGDVGLTDLPAGATVGTSSLRRRAQLLHLRPDLRVEDLRGNLDTRVQRLRDGRYDAVLLALAGLRRLGLEDAVTERLSPPRWLPAVGQGALGVAIRAGDDATAALVAGLEHPETRAATTAERALLRSLEGGCQVPIGALARIDGDRLALDAFVASLDGTELLRGSIAGQPADADALGVALAARLLERGADAILAVVRAAARDGALPAHPAP